MSLCSLEKCALTGLLGLLLVAASFGQSPADRGNSANDLARAVVAKELKVQDENHSRWMYRVDQEEQSTKKEKEVVQTSLGSLDRLVAVNGHPLNAKEEQGERQDRKPREKSSGTTTTRTDEQKRCGTMQGIFQDDSRCALLQLCGAGWGPDQTEFPA